MGEDNKEVEHECKYCGSMNTGSDEDCYRAPASEKERQADAKELINVLDNVFGDKETVKNEDHFTPQAIIKKRFEAAAHTAKLMNARAELLNPGDDKRPFIPELQELIEELEDLLSIGDFSVVSRYDIWTATWWLKESVKAINADPYV